MLEVSIDKLIHFKPRMVESPAGFQLLRTDPRAKTVQSAIESIGGEAVEIDCPSCVEGSNLSKLQNRQGLGPSSLT